MVQVSHLCQHPGLKGLCWPVTCLLGDCLGFYGRRPPSTPGKGTAVQMAGLQGAASLDAHLRPPGSELGGGAARRKRASGWGPSEGLCYISSSAGGGGRLGGLCQNPPGAGGGGGGCWGVDTARTQALWRHLTPPVQEPWGLRTPSGTPSGTPPGTSSGIPPGTPSGTPSGPCQGPHQGP